MHHFKKNDRNKMRGKAGSTLRMAKKTHTSVGAILARRRTLQSKKEMHLSRAKKATIWEMASIPELPPPKINPPFPAPPPPPPKPPPNISRQPNRGIIRREMSKRLCTRIVQADDIKQADEKPSPTLWPPIDTAVNQYTFPRGQSSPPTTQFSKDIPGNQPSSSISSVPQPPLPPSSLSSPPALPTTTPPPKLSTSPGSPLKTPSSSTPLRIIQIPEVQGCDQRETSVNPARSGKKNRGNTSAQQQRRRKRRAESRQLTHGEN